MSKKLYVGNLNYATTDDSLKNVFASYGEVLSALVIKDRETQRSKGFGFVELSDDAAAERAIAELNGREIEGRRVRVNVAEERHSRPPRNFNRGDFRRPRRDEGFAPSPDSSY